MGDGMLAKVSSSLAGRSATLKLIQLILVVAFDVTSVESQKSQRTAPRDSYFAYLMQPSNSLGCTSRHSR